MPTRKFNQNSYQHGQWNVICDVCGFKFKSGDIKKRWDGLQVCKDDWEIRQPLDFERGVKDDPSVPYTRPDSAEIGGTDINGNTFPPTFDADAKAIGDRPDPDNDGLVEGDHLENGEIVAGTVTKA